MNESLKTDELLENMETPTESGDVQPSDTIELLTESDDDGTSEPVDEVDSGSESQELTELEKLINKRTGYWQVQLQEADMKWVKNACNGKFEFSGPNEAFMIMNCYMGFAAAVARYEQEVKEKIESTNPALQASSIEACAFFVNKHSGSGIEAAQRSFRIAMALNPVIMEMRKLDEEIEKLRQAEKIANQIKEAESGDPLVIEPEV